MTTGVIDFTNIVAETDYELSATLEPSGAVLKRIRGYYDLTFSGVVTGALGRLSMGIVRHDANEGITFNNENDPRIAAQMIDEDWLWLDNMFLTTVGNIATGGWTRVPFDVKAQRRLKDSRISFVASNDGFAGGGTISIDVYARALLAMKNSG